MDVLEELESIALLTGGGSEVFKKVDALVDHLMTRIHELKNEHDQLRSILKTVLPLVENIEDKGPTGATWQSDELMKIIATIEELTQK